MATKVKVKNEGQRLSYEVSGGDEGHIGKQEREFEIGAIGSSISFLTLQRDSSDDITITAVTGNLSISIDGGKDKTIKKGNRLKLPKIAKRAVIREKVK